MERQPMPWRRARSTACLAIDGMPAAVPMEVARLTVDLMRAVPIGEPLRIELA
jgi:hypothetical protein